MQPEQLRRVEELYTSNLRDKGRVPAAVGWNSEDSQRMRFEKLTSLIEDRAPAVTINDYGCGYGAHLEHLVKQCGIRVTAYHGYDVSEPMLEAARAHLNFFRGTLDLRCTTDISTTADYTFVSGTFNVRFTTDLAEWQEFIETTLHRIDAHSIQGFAFNLLSRYVDWKQPHLYYADPCYWFDYCKQRFSSRVALLHDYPLYEWTIIVRKVIS